MFEIVLCEHEQELPNTEIIVLIGLVVVENSDIVLQIHPPIIAIKILKTEPGPLEMVEFNTLAHQTNKHEIAIFL